MTKKFFSLKIAHIIWVVILFFLAALPRGIELLNHNYLFGFDQGLFYHGVKQIVVGHKLTLIGAEVGGQGGLFQGPGWYYLLAIPFAITNGDPFGGMVLMFVIGITTVILSFFVALRIHGLRAGIITGFLVAVSPAIISQSRFIWPPFPLSVFAVLFIFFLFMVLSKRHIFLPLLAATVGFMAHFEIASAVPLLIQITLLSPILLIKKITPCRFFLYSIASFLLTQITLLFFDVRHNFIISKGIFAMFIYGKNPAHSITFTYIKSMIVNHFEIFRDNFLSTFYTNKFIEVLLFTFIVYGTILFIKNTKHTFEQKALVLYLVFSPIILYAIYLLYLWPMWQWWILELPIFYCFLLGILISSLWNDRIFHFIGGGILVFFSLHYIGNCIFLYQKDLHDYGGTAKIKGKIDALDYIYNDAKGKLFGLLVFTPPVYTYPYDYLLWWHGERTYHYIPYTEKKGIFYLLIEPDSEKPWSYKGWLETVVKTGDVLYEKKLPSGFIVQKRVAN